MRIVDPHTGKAYFEKRRRRYDETGHARELTFSCYRRFQFLGRDRTRQWFLEALESARRKWPVDVWAYVLMPEHVHLLVFPRTAETSVSGFLRDVKEPVARKAITFLSQNAPDWLPRVTAREGPRIRRRFWQPGGGYDRNVIQPATLRQMIDYIHANPVRRGLVEHAEAWEWSSARWFTGTRPVPLEIDRSVFDVLSGQP